MKNIIAIVTEEQQLYIQLLKDSSARKKAATKLIVQELSAVVKYKQKLKCLVIKLYVIDHC